MINNRRGYREIGLAIVTSGLFTWSFAATPLEFRGVSYEDALASSSSSSAVVFYALGNAYMAYATMRGSMLAWSTAAHTLSHARLGLRVAAVGLAVCCLGTHVPRVLAAIGHLMGNVVLIPGTAVWSTPVLALGISTFFIGIGYPGARSTAIKTRLWLLARYRYWQLRPLWSDLHAVFPDIALFSPVSFAREALQLGSMRLRYYRRYVEIRDGLVLLSRYADSPASAGTSSPTEQASHVKTALERYAAGVEPSGTATVIAPPQESSERDADVTALLALSQAMATTNRRADSAN